MAFKHALLVSLLIFVILFEFVFLFFIFLDILLLVVRSLGLTCDMPCRSISCYQLSLVVRRLFGVIL